MYFSQGIHNLVLPAWLLGIMGPNGIGRRGIAGNPLLLNTDLRSYYALGSPDSEEEPVIDHRGGIIPSPGSYTLLFGTIYQNKLHYSSEVGEVKVDLHDDGFPIATVTWELEGDVLLFNVFADRNDGKEAMVINVVRGFSNHQLFVTLCPIDQEGLTQVSELVYDSKINKLTIPNHPDILISETPIKSITCTLQEGHAGKLILHSKNNQSSCVCKASAATWAASFPVRANPDFLIPLNNCDIDFDEAPDMDDIEYDWQDLLDELPVISTSDEKVDYFYKVSALVLRLLSDAERKSITIGPSLQEEMWLPGLVFQTKALDRLGFGEEIVKPILNKMMMQVDTNGIIAKGKQWDSQGALVLAVFNHYKYSDDKNWLGEKYNVIKRIADWVTRQSKKDDEESILSGLLPLGAPSWFNPLYWEHDYYYFNNFWALSVLKNIVSISKDLGKHGDCDKFTNDMDNYRENIDNSISQVCEETVYLPAGPFKKDSAEMLFVLHGFYPLDLYLPSYQPIYNSYLHLKNNYFINGGLLIDQPWNSYASYFSILFAQAARFVGEMKHVDKVIKFLINHTTNKQGWAEGISPQSGLGSVGDSPNGYAAAEFVNLVLDLFAEQKDDNTLILLKGIPKKWLTKGVSAKNIRLFANSTLDLTAKLSKNKLTLNWKINNPNTSHLPQVYLEDAPEQVLLRQISNHLFELPDFSGELVINY
ncbi:MAG: hypothetical protein INQ03_11755 [Candidatus Heimdallarchaeota archaeon]|nr:hypothetical protein [Candidatus Heimdallarchaeota archaeon]